MTPNQLRQAYLDFFRERGHAIVPSASIVPENDPTTLFTGSGMQPMVPYLLGEKHPLGRRIADSQRCFRSEDIEEVGDNRHTTFFEMLGNWSLGDYFKAEQLPWFFTFLTEMVGLDPRRLYVSVFAGSPEIGIPRDETSVEIWRKLFAEVGLEAKVVVDAPEKGMQGGRIFFYSDKKNWWSRAGAPANMPLGEPGGPDSEVFFDFGAHLKLHEKSPFAGQPCHINCDCGRFLEIGNSVFMEYQKTAAGFVPLPQQNVDFGGGFERILAAVQDEPDIFKTALFQPLIGRLEEISGQAYDASPEVSRSFRVIADHVRAAIMLAVDGVEPGNKEQGYFARRLLRRSMRFARMIGIHKPFLGELVPVVATLYAEPYPQIEERQAQIRATLEAEEQRFARTLDKGLKEFDKLIQSQPETNSQQAVEISPESAFYLYETYGFPLEVTLEMAKEKGVKLGETGLETDFIAAFRHCSQRHAEASRTASAGKFKGGLLDHSEQTTRLHTATHLVHQALRQILGPQVQQAGSNITAERLRFDFTYPEKLRESQLRQVEQLVNEQIQADLPITIETTTLDEALQEGALAFFGERYGEKVKVYTIGNFSKEVCGGPHVEHTGLLGQFKLGKQEAVGSGKRRIYGYIEDTSP
jgi:alanyl-tRNA synthetase